MCLDPIQWRRTQTLGLEERGGEWYEGALSRVCLRAQLELSGYNWSMAGWGGPKAVCLVDQCQDTWAAAWLSSMTVQYLHVVQ